MQQVEPRAEAAARRIIECERRRRELRAGASSSPADVARARLALRTAKERAARAQQRLEDAVQRNSKRRIDRLHQQLLGARTFRSSPAYTRAAEQPLRLLRRLALPLPELYCYYLSLGGTLDAIEVDAYLHGLASLPHLDQMIITHSLWELSEPWT